MKNCIWKQTKDGEFWDTECDETFCFIVDGLKENGMKFCCYCGKKLVEKLFEDIKEE